MKEISDLNFAEDDFTAADLAKFELIKSEEEDLNTLAKFINQIVTAKVAKLSQEKDEFYSKQLALKELESDTFFNHSPSGYFSTDKNGIITKINDTLLGWLGYAKEDIIGKVTWQSLLSVGGKMYFETHYSPLLQMQGYVQEISFEMVKKDKTRLPIIINTKQIRDENGKVKINYSTVFDVSQRKSYEKELLIAKRNIEEKNELIEYTFRNASLPIYYVLENGNIYDSNDIAAEHLGYTREELNTLKICDIDKNYDEKKWVSVWAELKEKKKIAIETQHKKKDGTLVDLFITANYVKYGDLELKCSYVQDITEKKKIAEELKLMDFAFKRSATPILLLLPTSRFYSFNDSLLNLLGYSREEFCEMNLLDIATEMDEASCNKQWDEIREKKNVVFNCHFERKDGVLLNVEVSSNLINYNEIEINFLYINDVTKKLKADEDLKNSNQRYEYATLATSDVIWEVDLLKKEAFISKNFTNVFGHPVDDGWTPLENNIWRQNIHPDEIENVLKSQYEALNDETKIKNWKGEYRLRKSDGTYAMVLDRTFGIRDEQGKIVKVVGAMQDVTKQRVEEERLRLMESVILNTNDAVLITEAEPIDEPGPRILFANKAFTKMTGYSQEELLGKSPRMMQNKYTDRKELDKLRRSLEKWEPSDVTLLNTKKNGEIYWVNLHITPLANDKGWFTHWISIERDVTKEKKEEERLRLMESVILNTNDSIIVTDANPISETSHAIVFVNDAFCKITGYSKEEVIGKNPRILQCEETDKKELDKFREKIGKWENAEMTIINKKKNGDKFWASVVAIPLTDEKGWITHWIGVQRDVTKEIEDAIEKENLLKELLEKNLELRQFSYITSHNLRAPLTNLISICDIIEPEIGTDALTVQLIDAFKTSTHQLNETLNDLIEILIIKENRNKHQDQLTFEEIFKKITESLSRSLLESKVIINADFSAAPSITFVNEYLESVFLNLLTNAVKYRHPDRDPIITIKTSKEPNGDTLLTFADNGIGINMALAKDKIFGLYKRFHNNADSKGIGLYLIHSQITALGGKIEVESAVNIGTTFTITFK
jgi:PAS domain S-box-containing protein